MIKVCITREAVLEMTKEVLSYPNVETAWGIYGLILDDDSIVITGVLHPSSCDIVRQYATTTFGGNQQFEAVRWLKANSREMQKHDLHPQGARFAFLFKGHSHHHLGVDSYSWQDHKSILEAVEVDGLEVAIGPLATLEIQGPTISTPTRWRGTLVIDQSQRVWLRFYYISRAMVEQGRKRPILVEPEVVDAKTIPVLPPLSWQFTREDDYMEQLRHLKSYGCTIQVVYREIQNGPPHEIQFLVSKPNWRGPLSIVTNWDYPNTQPTFQILNVSDHQPTEQSDYAGADHLLLGPLWEPGMDLLESVFRLEARGEL